MLDGPGWAALAAGHKLAEPTAQRPIDSSKAVYKVVLTVAAGRGWSIVPEPCRRAAPTARTTIVRYRRRVHNQIYAITRAGVAEHRSVAQIIEALRRASP